MQAAQPIKPEVQTLVVPAQEWMDIAEAYSADLLADFKGSKGAASVRATQHRGHLITTVGVIWGGLDGGGMTISYRLLPQSLYSGQTWMNPQDLAAQYEQGRVRGDETGLVVKANGSQVVLAQKVQFQRALPTCSPLPLARAVEYHRRNSRWGWRAMHFQQAQIRWGLLNGHPVSCHTNPDGEVRQVLYWLYKEDVQEILVSPGCALVLVEDVESFCSPSTTKTAVQPSVQLGLF